MLKNSQFVLSALVGVAFLSGCATVTPVSGTFPDISPLAAQSGNDQGQTVRWGGKLIETHPEAHETCFMVLGEPLRRDGRPEPERGEAHIGRFLACATGFYDPMLYRSGREITFIGRVQGIAHRKIGQFIYTYPTLAASTVYLWPIRSPRPRVQERVYMGAGWGWGPGWWGYYPGWWWY